MEMKILLLVIVLAMIAESTNGFATSISDMEKPKKCNMERVHKLLGYNCAHLNLRDIPQGLKSKTEVSYFSKETALNHHLISFWFTCVIVCEFSANYLIEEGQLR